MRELNEKNFIKYLCQKDERALYYVIDHYSGLIRSIIRKHLGSISHFEEECLNDVLLAIWHNIDCFDDRENSFKNWVAAISKYKSIDYKRKYLKHLQEVGLEEIEELSTDTLDIHMLNQEIHEELDHMLQYLTPSDADLLRAHYLDDHPIKELSHQLALKPSAIYNKLSRSRKKLRQLFMNH